MQRKFAAGIQLARIDLELAFLKKKNVPWTHGTGPAQFIVRSQVVRPLKSTKFPLLVSPTPPWMIAARRPSYTGARTRLANPLHRHLFRASRPAGAQGICQNPFRQTGQGSVRFLPDKIRCGLFAYRTERRRSWRRRHRSGQAAHAPACQPPAPPAARAAAAHTIEVTTVPAPSSSAKSRSKDENFRRHHIFPLLRTRAPRRALRPLPGCGRARALPSAAHSLPARRRGTQPAAVCCVAVVFGSPILRFKLSRGNVFAFCAEWRAVRYGGGAGGHGRRGRGHWGAGAGLHRRMRPRCAHATARGGAAGRATNPAANSGRRCHRRSSAHACTARLPGRGARYGT